MKRLLGLLVLATTTAAAIPALAGAKEPWPVEIDKLYNDAARGALGSARNSTDTKQYIYCSVDSTGVGVCVAVDASGAARSCISTSPGFIQAVAAISGDSYVLFQWDANSTCTSLFVYNSSVFEPKK